MRSRTSLPTSLAAVAAVAAVSVLAAGCGGSSPTTATTAQNGLLAYSHCMRSHGVSGFPDPAGSAGIPKNEVVQLANDPQFNTASNACAHLAPDGLGPHETVQDVHTRTTAMLAFARCIRGHGFPGFPDPTSSGQLTAQMITSAGIDLHQPAVRQAGDACVGVTHGVITKATVARAVAGP